MPFINDVGNLGAYSLGCRALIQIEEMFKQKML